jgi:hypothetical protein
LDVYPNRIRRGINQTSAFTGIQLELQKKQQIITNKNKNKKVTFSGVKVVCKNIHERGAQRAIAGILRGPSFAVVV